MSDNQLIAYRLQPENGMELVSCERSREWMDASPQRFANRCLPMLIANQAGWCVTCPVGFMATWNGGSEIEATSILFDGAKTPMISSHFGCGIVTFSLPYLFRTPIGTNLWVKGPANAVKDSIQPLEGIVETDWTAATFTMNWKMTRPRAFARFEAGEPICMIVPIARGLAESLDPQLVDIGEDPELERTYREWANSRAQFNGRLGTSDPDAVREGWQRDYFKGRNGDSKRFADHQTKVKLRPFR